MAELGRFKIRHADVERDDAQFMTAAFDSCLPFQASIGSEAQWGSQLFSQVEGFLAKQQRAIEDANKYRLTGEGESYQVWIAETERDGDGDGETGLVPVGHATTRANFWPDYVSNQNHLKDLTTTAKNFTFLVVLVTDFTAGPLRKGVGATLIQHVKACAENEKRDTIYVDCWAGNNGKLVRYSLSLSGPSGFTSSRQHQVLRGPGIYKGGRLSHRETEQGAMARSIASYGFEGAGRWERSR